MGVNGIQDFVIRIVKMLDQNCSYCVKKYPYHLCTMILICFLYMFSSLVFTLVACCFPVVGLAFLVYKMFIATGHQTVKDAESKYNTLKKSRSRRTFRSMYHVHVLKQHNESSFMQDLTGVRQNAKETSDKIFNSMNAEEKNVISTVENEDLVDKRTLNEQHPRLDEKYRKCSLDVSKVKIQESLNDQHDHGGCIDDDDNGEDEKGLMDLERTKRLESLMERRRSRTPTKFQILRNAMGVGNKSCDKISTLNIPKKNPFLLKKAVDLNPPLPGSAPTYMIKNNPFDLPYDPHEEKPILTGDSFKDEFMATHQKEPFDTESINDKHETYFDTEFAIKQLRSLGVSKVASKKDDNKQPQEICLIPNVVSDDSHAIEEGESSADNRSKEVKLDRFVDQTKDLKVNRYIDHTKQHKVDHSIDHTKEHEVDHDVVSPDQSTSSYTSSEDEPIRKPNKEAILHCLSMSRMRVLSQKNSFHRTAESFDCGPSALFDKSKIDCFIFGPTKQIRSGSSNSLASDMQVEVSELGSPRSTNISSVDEEGKGSLVNSTNPSEMDLNEVGLRDMDEVSEQGTFEIGLSKPALDSYRFESTEKQEEIDEDS